MNDPRQAAAAARMQMRSPAEARMYFDNQQNAGGIERLDENGKPYYDPEPHSEYPRMLYRKTDTEQHQEWADSMHEKSTEEKMVINRFDGLLCETQIANSADDAERMAADGWDISPKAAYGVAEGIVTATTAKDDHIAEQADRIAQLEAQLAAQAEKRGPGRPPKTSDDI